MKRFLTTILCLSVCVALSAQRKHVNSDRLYFLIEDPTYKESEDGSITPKLSGGTRPYTYLWTGPDGFSSKDSVLFNIPAGTYAVFIHDARCGKFNDTIEVVSRSTLVSTLKTFRIASVSPNPFQDEVELTVRSNEEQLLHIEVFRSNGILYTDVLTRIDEGETKVRLDLAKAPSGIYILNLCNEENCKQTARIIKIE